MRDLRLLVPDGAALAASPQARFWLVESPARRLLDLFSAWTRSSSRQEAEDRGGPRSDRRSPATGLDSSAWAEGYAGLLRGWPQGQPLTSAALCVGLGLPDARHTARMEEMLQGPLTWLGIVAPAGSEPALYSLTATGADLLRGQPPPWSDPAPGGWLLDGTPVVEVVGSPDPALLFDLESFAECLARAKRYRLSAATIARGLAGGVTLDQMLRVLEEGSGTPLARDLAERLQRWADDAGRVQLLHGVILETRDADLLRTLYRQAGLRRHVTRLLSPRHALLHPGREAYLARLLARRGFHGPLAWSSGRQPRGDCPASGWVAAASLYLTLSERLGLPPLLSAQTVEAAVATLRPHEQRLVAEVKRCALARLPADELAATAREPEVPGRSLSPAAIRDDIEWAIAGGRPLQIWYATGERGASAPRVVESLLLDTYGLHTYLIAFCRQRLAQRVFRLDRIKASARPAG